MKRLLTCLLPFFTITLFLIPQLAGADDCSVTNGNDSGMGSLRNCIDNVAVNDGDTVTIPANTTINLTGGTIDLIVDVTILGAGDGTSIIDGSGNGNNRIFNVDDGTPLGVSAVISGVTLQSATDNDGGAIYVYYGALRLVNSILKDNIEENNYGGAIFVSYGSLIVESSTFLNNEAQDYGGAIYSEYSSMTIIDSSFDENHTDPAGTGYAGAIYNYISATQITSSTFTRNEAKNKGGAIYTDESSLLLEDCIIGGPASNVGNEAGQYGGGIYSSYSDVMLRNSTISHNLTTGSGYYGGGIYAEYGTVVILNSTVSENGADYGGGMYNYYSALVINQSTLSENHATDVNGSGGEGYGGGLYNDGYYGGSVITNSTFSGNTAEEDGGAIYSYQGTMDIANTTFSGNTADNDGGGIFNYNNYGSLLNNVTIANNVADADNAGGGDGGGLYNDNSGYTLTFSNTIIANNSVAGPGTNPDCFSDAGGSSQNLISRGHNLVGVLSGDCDVLGDTSTLLTGDAGLDPMGLANNGGTTQTIALVASSQSLEAGDNVLCEDTDQRGTTRPQGTDCDLGAFEAGPSADLSSTKVIFPGVNVGDTSTPIDVALTNNGTIPLTLNSIAVTNGDFAQTNDCGASVDVGALCTISITSSPSALGPSLGDLSVDSSANVRIVSLIGAGVSGGGCSLGAGSAAPGTAMTLTLLAAALTGVYVHRRRIKTRSISIP